MLGRALTVAGPVLELIGAYLSWAVYKAMDSIGSSSRSGVGPTPSPSPSPKKKWLWLEFVFSSRAFL